ncbi:hypothetical protein FT666_06615 [Providencia rettgeri]|nr:hypothetical protein RB151_044040 [Providencia rettgeri]AVL73314.1 hypothetical protein CEQ08_06065 [Providencia rettgeri]EKH6495463.1 EpsG family protein [Providencia rettgeri]ELR5052732.1 EpsG family protein [Providencia rettgeri]ELR5154080.1 EpsG family protein [Providencia rettgeri]
MFIINKNKLILLILCLAYASMLTFLIDADYLRDRSSYSGYYALISDDMLANAYNNSLIKLLTEEPIFLLINIFISKVLNINNLIIPSIYVFFITYCFSYLTLKRAYNPFFFALCFCMLVLISMSLHAQLVVLRQSIATCIMLYFIQKKSNINKLIIITIICAFIHNSFFILTLFFSIMGIFNKSLSKNKWIFISIFISIFFTSSFYFIGKYFSFRQMDFLNHENVATGYGLFLWGSCLVVILIKNINNRSPSLVDLVSLFGLIFYTLNYYFLPIGGRLLITFIPFILISLTSNFNYTKKSIIYLIAIYDIMFIAVNTFKLNENLINDSLIPGYTIFNIIGF